MSLLRDIQDAAIDNSVALSVLLRKCKVLAARLGNQDFKNWIELELNGYKSNFGLPEYRQFEVNSKGDFSGAFGSGLKNADIPMMCIHKKLKESLSHSYLTQSVASLESTVKQAQNNDEFSLREPWVPDATALCASTIYENLNCMQAWKVIPVSNLVNALDSVRNSILSFALEIESEDPDAGEAKLNTSPVPQEKISQIFNTYISGNVQNVATGSTNFEQHATNNATTPEVFALLTEAIELLRDKSEYEEIKDSVKEMELSYGTETFKNKYQNFMSILSNHITVLGPVVGASLPALSALIA